MTATQKNRTIWAAAIFVVIVLGVGGYKMSRSGSVQGPVIASEKVKDIVLEPRLIEQTSLREQRMETALIKKEMEDIKKNQSGDGVQVKTVEKPTEATSTPEQIKIPTPEEIAQRSAPGMRKYPPPPPPMMPGQTQQMVMGPNGVPIISPQPGMPIMPPPQEEIAIGGIGISHNANFSKPVSEKKDAKDAKDATDKKKARSIYLPPSFMEAELLTGFDAATSGSSNNNPEPVLLRVQTPAQLPNDIKANLKGCFIIAEAVGRLDKERADVRIISLSCVSKKGASVIDAKVKGFVTDSDGKVGLSGRIVSRMGSAVARSFVAGLFGGAGEALKTSTMTQAVSPLGTSSAVDPTQIGKNAAGSGIASGASALQKFYLDLAKQATPVVEVSPTKAITVVLSEGVEVQFKDITQGQNDF